MSRRPHALALNDSNISPDGTGRVPTVTQRDEQMRMTMEQEALRAAAIQGALFHGLSDELATLLLSAAAVRQSSAGRLSPRQ